MPATAENLRELHELHQRAKMLRDRLASGPKTLAARQAALARRQAELVIARDALKRAKAEIKSRETQAQATRARTDELRARLNTIKKQAEYDALRNDIAHANANITRLEDEALELMGKVETQESDLKSLEADVARLNAEADALTRELESRAVEERTRLGELEAAIVAAEAIIPEEQRDQYRRVIKQRGADAMAAVDVDFKTHAGSCHGCYTSLTTQMVNDLLGGETLTFCRSCGRILYPAEVPENTLKRRG
jgi:predicted  nucleic acid-binding Zn-ribbon protein